MFKSLRFSLASLVMLAFCSLSVMAQSQATTAQISGVVSDSNGAGIWEVHPNRLQS